jgi:predicted glycoside hydrolase/deacetylase ChbG (UPF0249 family)
MVKIIINADDLGISPIVNKEIEDSLDKGLISSSTILANCDYFNEVVRIAQSHPGNSFGVHLNITEGRSLTKNDTLRKAGIIDEDGFFIKEYNYNSRLYNPEVINAVTEEWSAQVEEILSHGICISHLDGHHHCHTWFGFNESLIEVAKKFRINKVRRTYRYPVESVKERVIDSISRGLCRVIDAKRDRNMNRVLRSIRNYQDRQYCEILLRRNALVTTDFFCSYEDLMNFGGTPIIPDNCTIELMCHPGHQNYKREYLQIQTNTTEIIDGNIELINYYQL